MMTTPSSGSKVHRDAVALISSEYIVFVVKVLEEMDETTFTKAFITAYLLRQCNDKPGLVYDGKQQVRLLQKALLQSGGTADMLSLEFESALTACRALAAAGVLVIDGPTLALVEGRPSPSEDLCLNSFNVKLVSECTELSEAYMLEELLRHVWN